MAISDGGSAQNYETVNAAGTNPQGTGFGDPGYAPSGNIGRYDSRGSEDDFTQAGNLYRLLSAEEKDRLTSNIANAMKSVSHEINWRQIGHFTRADPAYGAAVQARLRL